MAGGLGTPDGPVLVCGEVRTCLLPTRDAVDERTAVRLLRLRADERVRVSRHPNRYAVSPDVLTGVDCRLPTATGARIRAVGTVTGRAALVEGRVLQSTAYFGASGSGPDRRRPWGHYLVRPGSLVPVGRLPGRQVAEGFLTDGRPDELDIGSIAESLLARIARQHRVLDHDPPLTGADTRLRWTAVAVADGERASLLFTKAEDGLRTVALRLPPGTAPAEAAGLCGDLALHDWLLTTVVDRLDGLPVGAGDSTAVLKVLRPLVDHLLHLWMPGVRTDPELGELWTTFDRVSGVGRQWQTQVQRIRDQLALRTLLARDEVLPSR